MTSAPAQIPSSLDPAEHWHTLLRPVLTDDPDFPVEFFARLRDARLTFGDRVHCPFLRPFFLSPEDERRVPIVAETVADLGERVVTASLATSPPGRTNAPRAPSRRLRPRQYLVSPRRLPPPRFAEICRVQR